MLAPMTGYDLIATIRDRANNCRCQNTVTFDAIRRGLHSRIIPHGIGIFGEGVQIRKGKMNNNLLRRCVAIRMLYRGILFAFLFGHL